MAKSLSAPSLQWQRRCDADSLFETSRVWPDFGFASESAPLGGGKASVGALFAFLQKLLQPFPAPPRG
eukprot:2776594-Lingulodinium_polyedra.AAC.1